MDVAEPLVADLGTGSGAIALAIAQEVPRARVHAVEADPLARQWAARNIARCAAAAPHTAGRVILHAGDFRTALQMIMAGLADLVISNPPYIPVGRVGAARGRRVRPGHRAVGRRRRARRGPGHRGGRRPALLRPRGLVAIEHGAQQGSAVYWLFPEERGWRETRNHKDLACRDRFVTAARA